MRVLVWNVANKREAFAALTSLAADIEVLNEAAPPTDANGVCRQSDATRSGGRGRWRF